MMAGQIKGALASSVGLILDREPVVLQAREAGASTLQTAGLVRFMTAGALRAETPATESQLDGPLCAADFSPQHPD